VPSDYTPWKTLFPPHYWVPALYLTSTGDSLGLYGVAYTSGSDLLNRLGYSALLTYRTDARFLGGGASVYVNRWRPVYSAVVTDLVTPYGDIYRSVEPPEGGGPYIPSVESTNTRYWDHRLRFALGVGYPLNENARVSGFFQGTLRTPLDDLPADPAYENLPTRGLLNSVGIGWARAKGEAYPLSISPEYAQSVGVGVEVTSRVLGSYVYDDTNQRVPFDQVQATAEWRRYLTVPWLANHVVAWKLAGGASVGDAFRYGSFRLGGSFSEYGITVVPSEWRMLRGYFPASDSGEWYWLGSAEYRFPIWNVDRGVGTLPLFVKNVSGALVLDGGNAFDDATGLGQALLGVGAELRFYFLYFYGSGIYARTGYAFAPQGDGIPFGSPYGAYLSLGSSF
jgi:hypothetical protein